MCVLACLGIGLHKCARVNVHHAHCINEEADAVHGGLTRLLVFVPVDLFVLVQSCKLAGVAVARILPEVAAREGELGQRLHVC